MDNDDFIAGLAGELGISSEAVRKWRARQRGVPHHCRDDLRELAARYGRTLSRDQLDSFGKPDAGQVAA